MANHMTKVERMALNRAYIKSHREQWREQGFIQVTVVAHTDDKEEVAAFSELVKFERLLTSVLHNDAEAIAFTSSRNMGRPADVGQADRVKRVVERLGLAQPLSKRINVLLDGAVSYANAYHRALNSVELMASQQKKNYFIALAVAYSNLSAATMRLATALASGNDRVDAPVEIKLDAPTTEAK